MARIALRGKGNLMETTEKEKLKPADNDKQTLSLEVFAPRKANSQTFKWPKTKKVGDAAREAALAFGYSGTNPGLEIVLPDGTGRTLDNNKTLVAEHLKDGDQLDITDTGGGV